MSASAGGVSGGQAFRGEAPRGSMAMENTQTELGRAVGRMANSAVDAYKTSAEAELVGKTGKLTDEHTRKVGYETTVLDATGRKTDAETDRTRQETITEKERAEAIRAQAKAAHASSAASYAAAGLSSETARQYNKYGMPGYGIGERIIRNAPGIPPGGIPLTDLPKRAF